MKKIVWAISFLLLVSSWASADVGITLQLDRLEATLVDSVRMEVHVSGSRSSDAVPRIQGLEDFIVTKGGTASRVEIINGQVNAGLTYTYFIQPQKTGTFAIGPVVLEVDGRALESNRATLVVQEPSQQDGSEKDSVFMEATVSPHDIYVEQQALYILKLHRRVNVDNLSLRLPEKENLVFKQLGQPQVYQTTVAGAAYQVLEIRYALLASKDGAHVIGPSRMGMTVRRPGRQTRLDDFFNNPFSASPGRPLTVASESIEVNVHALPEENKPTDYSGLVGSFQLESRLEPTSLKAGDSATLTVQISGRGNVKRIPDLSIPELPFVRTYGDQPVLESEQDEQGISGTKTMKWALVPEKAGKVDIPALRLNFFNPETGQYNTLQSAVHTLSVLPGTAETATLRQPPSAAAGEDLAKKEVKQIGKDILPIHTSVGSLFVPFRQMSSGWLLGLLLMGPPSVYFLLLTSMKLRKRSPERMIQIRSRNAFKILARHCRKDLSSCADCLDAFRNYLNDRFCLSVGTLTSVDAEKVLQAQGVTPETVHKLRSLVRRFENAVYAGDHDKPAKGANELLRLVKALEREIR